MSHRLFRDRTICTLLTLMICLLALSSQVRARRRPAPAGGQRAIVVDERLAALREQPQLTAPLVERLNRGHMISIMGPGRVTDGVNFYRVAVTRRTRGWLQAESVVSPLRHEDDEKLLRLIRGSEGFDRIARAHIFLETFLKSPLRPAVLLLYGEAAQEAAEKLSREAMRRLEEREMIAGGAPIHSYFMNYRGLDRYRKQGIVFTFDAAAKQFRYDGAAWREILRLYPRSPEAEQARGKLKAQPTM